MNNFDWVPEKGMVIKVSNDKKNWKNEVFQFFSLTKEDGYQQIYACTSSVYTKKEEVPVNCWKYIHPIT